MSTAFTGNDVPDPDQNVMDQLAAQPCPRCGSTDYLLQLGGLGGGQIRCAHCDHVLERGRNG